MVWTRTQLGGLNTINGANGLNLAQNGQGASFSNYELNAGYLLTPYLNLNGEYTYTQGSISNATGGHRPHWHEVSLQADYLLSKTTDLYAQLSYQRIGADGSAWAPTSAAGRRRAPASRRWPASACATSSERAPGKGGAGHPRGTASQVPAMPGGIALDGRLGSPALFMARFRDRRA